MHIDNAKIHNAAVLLTIEAQKSTLVLTTFKTFAVHLVTKPGFEVMSRTISGSKLLYLQSIKRVNT